ncbi:hypothetical protein ZWY2020_050860 [Hordeum vulgare]|nr:hypothetical protein ZWY2020_050860 [Hordeum vulgare]
MKSIQNWIEDLFWKQLDFDYSGMSEAKVYRAMASFCALDLITTITTPDSGPKSVMVNYGLKDVTLLTFGQPRIVQSSQDITDHAHLKLAMAR